MKMYKVLLPYGCRGVEVVRANMIVSEDEMLSRFINALKKTGTIIEYDVPTPIEEGEAEALKELSAKEDNKGFDPDADDPRMNENIGSFPVAAEQQDLTSYEDKSWRKYLKGEDLKGPEGQAVLRARVKMGIDQE